MGFRESVSGRGIGVAAAFACCVGMGATAPAAAQNATWKSVSLIRDSKQTTEKWAWLAEELAARTDGALTLDLSTFPELGLTGTEFIRLLSIGLIDAGELITGYVSGEVPLIEGVQMMGVYDGLEQAEQAYDAWTEAVALPNAARMGGTPVASFAFANMYLWSTFPVDSLDDLEGKTVHVFSTAQADYLTALGAEPVTIPLAEVPQALGRGVVDAVITGPDVANRTQLDEVVGYVTDLMFGPGAGWVVVSDRALSRLDAETRAELDGVWDELQDRGWALAYEENETNLEAVIGRGVVAKVPTPEEWRPRLQEIAREVVLPAWAERAGGDEAVEAFNAAIAPIVGVEAAR